jgi:hypothetical protein
VQINGTGAIARTSEKLTGEKRGKYSGGKQTYQSLVRTRLALKRGLPCFVVNHKSFSFQSIRKPASAEFFLEKQGLDDARARLGLLYCFFGIPPEILVL